MILDGHQFYDELLRLGYGRLLVIALNRAHLRALLCAELDARRHGRRLWSECSGG